MIISAILALIHSPKAQLHFAPFSIKSYRIKNNNSYTIYVQCFSCIRVVLGSTAPLLIFPIPKATKAKSEFVTPIKGIYWYTIATSAYPTKEAPIFNVDVKFNQTQKEK